MSCVRIDKKMGSAVVRKPHGLSVARCHLIMFLGDCKLHSTIEYNRTCRRNSSWQRHIDCTTQTGVWVRTEIIRPRQQ